MNVLAGFDWDIKITSSCRRSKVHILNPVTRKIILLQLTGKIKKGLGLYEVTVIEMYKM